MDAAGRSVLRDTADFMEAAGRLPAPTADQQRHIRDGCRYHAARLKEYAGRDTEGQDVYTND